MFPFGPGVSLSTLKIHNLIAYYHLKSYQPYLFIMCRNEACRCVDILYRILSFHMSTTLWVFLNRIYYRDVFCNNADLILKTGSGSRLKSLLIKSLSQLKLKKIACKLISRTCSDFLCTRFLRQKKKQTNNEIFTWGSIYVYNPSERKQTNKKRET